MVERDRVVETQAYNSTSQWRMEGESPFQWEAATATVNLVEGMKISYGIYQDLKGTPYAVRPGQWPLRAMLRVKVYRQCFSKFVLVVTD